MKIDTISLGVQFIYRALPYCELIKDIDLTCSDVIYFSWRSHRFKLNIDSGTVHEVEGGILVGSDISILVEKLIKYECLKSIVL